MGWTEFYGLYRKLIYNLCRKSGLRHEESEEVTQDVFARVAGTIGDFESDPARGTFRGWLMNLTRWRISDKFRGRGAADAKGASLPGDSDDRTATIDRIPDSADGDAAWEHEWKEHVLAAAMDRIARRSKAKNFQVFDLSVRQQWPVSRIAKELRMSAASIYLINHRLAKQLKDEIAKLKDQLG